MGDQRLVREALRDPDAFVRCRRRLEEALTGSCEPGGPWAANAAASIWAALDFASGDPVAARVLTIHSACRRFDHAEFDAMVASLAKRLRRGAPSTLHPERTAAAAVRRICRQVLLQLELWPRVPPRTIAPQLIVFALTPYVGFEEAKRWASQERFLYP